MASTWSWTTGRVGGEGARPCARGTDEARNLEILVMGIFATRLTWLRVGVLSREPCGVAYLEGEGLIRESRCLFAGASGEAELATNESSESSLWASRTALA